MGTSYEMLWDCAFCGTKKLLGVTHRHCPGCGAAQDPKARYFPPEGQEIEVKDHVFVGADKSCAACNTPNSAKAAFCTNCGAGLDGAKAVELKQDAPPQSAQKQPNQKAQQNQNKQQKKRQAKSRARLYVILASIAAIVLFYIFYSREKHLTVQAHAWSRVVDVEEYYESSEKEECSSMPSGADVKRRYSESRSRQVKDGETCRESCTTTRNDKGDGSFSKGKSCSTSCTPKYRTQHYTVSMCDFTIGKWRVKRQAKAGGAGRDPKPIWPELKLAAGAGAKGYGKEREGKKVESYELAFKADGDKEVRCAYSDLARWDALAEGEGVSVDFDVLGNPRCDSLRKP